MDIECYYLTKNVLMKIQQNKYFHNLYKCATNTQEKNLTTFCTGFRVFILEYLGTILPRGRTLKILKNTRRGEGNLKAHALNVFPFVSQEADLRFQHVCITVSDT